MRAVQVASEVLMLFAHSVGGAIDHAGGEGGATTSECDPVWRGGLCRGNKLKCSH